MESLPGFFFAAFGSREDAVRWAIEAQEGLMDVDWAEDVLEQPGCEELEVAVTSGRGVGGEEEADVVTVFRGPRARMGIHASGRVARSIDRSTGRAKYTGRVTNRTARIMSQAEKLRPTLGADCISAMCSASFSGAQRSPASQKPTRDPRAAAMPVLRAAGSPRVRWRLMRWAILPK